MFVFVIYLLLFCKFANTSYNNSPIELYSKSVDLFSKDISNSHVKLSEDDKMNIESMYEKTLISYCDKTSIIHMNCGKWCDVLRREIIHQQIYHHQKTNILIWIYETKNDFNIIYRGTQTTSIENWMRNIQIFQDPYNCMKIDCCQNCYIHQGFLEMYYSITPELIHQWKNIMTYSKKKINVAGHSLGGSLASILVMDLINENITSTNSIDLYTYGSPRTGNNEFSDWMTLHMDNHNIKSYRIVNNRDPISHIPPLFENIPISMKYKHIPQEIWLNGDNMIYCNKTNPEDPTCSFSLYSAFNINDHFYFFNKYTEIKTLFNICQK